MVIRPCHISPVTILHGLGARVGSTIEIYHKTKCRVAYRNVWLAHDSHGIPYPHTNPNPGHRYLLVSLLPWVEPSDCDSPFVGVGSKLHAPFTLDEHDSIGSSLAQTKTRIPRVGSLPCHIFAHKYHRSVAVTI